MYLFLCADDPPTPPAAICNGISPLTDCRRSFLRHTQHFQIPWLLISTHTLIYPMSQFLLPYLCSHSCYHVNKNFHWNLMWPLAALRSALSLPIQSDASHLCKHRSRSNDVSRQNICARITNGVVYPRRKPSTAKKTKHPTPHFIRHDFSVVRVVENTPKPIESFPVRLGKGPVQLPAPVHDVWKSWMQRTEQSLQLLRATTQLPVAKDKLCVKVAHQGAAMQQQHFGAGGVAFHYCLHQT